MALHFFDKEVATKYGIESAILLNNIYFWVEKNRANGKELIDGYYWTYNSARAFKEMFPYMSESKIRRTLKSLEENGLIKSANHNKTSYDRTIWYTVTELGESVLNNASFNLNNASVNLQNGKINLQNGLTDMQNRSEQNDEPIPYNNTDITTDIKPYVNTDTPVSDKPKAKRKEPIVYYPNDDELNTAFEGYVQMRKEIKKPMTERAIKLAMKKLEDLSSVCGMMNNDLAVDIVNQSVMRGWLGLFPIDEKKPKQTSDSWREGWENA